MKLLTRILPLAALLVSISINAAEEFKALPGCPPDTDCCEWGTWKTSKKTPVYSTPGGKKVVAQLKKHAKVQTTEGKHLGKGPTPSNGAAPKDLWWVKVKLANGHEGWVDGNDFIFESRCP